MAQPLPLYGLMAEFDDAGRLVDAVKRARADGYRRLDWRGPDSAPPEVAEAPVSRLILEP